MSFWTYGSALSEPPIISSPNPISSASGLTSLKQFRPLLDYALSHWDVGELTVNEQNPQAIAFCEHEGFAAYMRTDTDEEGEPFPLICMRLADR